MAITRQNGTVGVRGRGPHGRGGGRVLKRLGTLALTLTVGACAPFASPVAPSGTEQEAFILSETERFAQALKVNVRGVLTDDRYIVTDPVTGLTTYAAGWYSRGRAYYYRPYIVKQTDFSYLSAIAAHEACHAISAMHDRAHADCIAGLDVRNYSGTPLV